MITVYVAATLLSIDESEFPGWAKFEIVDTAKRTHRFSEKLAVIELDGDVVRFRSTIVSQKGDVVLISSLDPDGIESDENVGEFELFSRQIQPTT